MNAYKNSVILKYEHFPMAKFSFACFEINSLILQKLFLIINILILPVFCKSQDTIVISPKVGKIIDSTEKVKYGIMPYYSRSIFISAVVIQYTDSIYILKVMLKPDSISERSISHNEIEGIRQLISEGQINYHFEKRYSEVNFLIAKSNKLYHNGFRIKLGLGGSAIGFAGGASFSFIRNNNIFTVRYLSSTELDFGILGSTYPLESVSEFGILYGFTSVRSNKNHEFTISTGLSLVTGIKRGNFLHGTGFFFGDQYYEEVSYSKLGIPIELQYMPKNTAGIGFTIFGNFMESDLLGALICLYF